MGKSKISCEKLPREQTWLPGALLSVRLVLRNVCNSPPALCLINGLIGQAGTSGSSRGDKRERRRGGSVRR
jgi:hypothetical protein